MSVIHRLMPLSKLCLIIGLCSFTINPENSTIFNCTNASLIYSILFSFIAITLMSLTTIWTGYSNLYCQTAAYHPSVTNNINDIIQLSSTLIMYNLLLIISVKNRRKHVRFLNAFSRVYNNAELLYTERPYRMASNCSKKLLFYCLALVIIGYTMSMAYIFFSDPRSNWIVKIYPILSILKHVTNLSNEIYLKFFVVTQINLQSTVNRLFAKSLSDDGVIERSPKILISIYELERLKLFFGCAFNERFAIAELRQFSMTLMVAFGLVLNFRNMEKLWFAAVVLLCLKSVFLVYNATLVHAIGRLENQVSCIVKFINKHIYLQYTYI